MGRRDVRQEMIRGAAQLLAERGVHGTSFSVVTESTRAPRGSIYHHFPGGKTELLSEAIAAVGAGVTELIDALDAVSPTEVVDAFVEGWRAAFLASGGNGTCAVANASAGAAAEPALAAATRAVFDQWLSALARAFVRSGVDPSEASDLAAVCLAAMEGALILARAGGSDRVFDSLARRLPLIVDGRL